MNNNQWNTQLFLLLSHVYPHTMCHDSDDLSRRYNNLDTQIQQRNQQLQSALTKSQGVQDSLDSLLRWLDETERSVHRMEKGTILVVKKEPLVDNLREQKVLVMTQASHVENMSGESENL